MRLSKNQALACGPVFGFVSKSRPLRQGAWILTVNPGGKAFNLRLKQTMDFFALVEVVPEVANSSEAGSILRGLLCFVSVIPESVI
jgi:hypothetical protein